MNTELKPCPFCGGEAEAREWAAWSPTIYGVTSVVCTECAAGIEVDTAELWLHDAAWYWNSRAERTCHDIGGEAPFEAVFRCSECLTMDFGGTPFYCRNCGAKVVEC